MRTRAMLRALSLVVPGLLLATVACTDSGPELPTAPAEATATVTVSVAASCAGVVPGVDVLVDGEAEGHVAAGGELVFVMTGAGEHEIALRAADGREWRGTLAFFYGEGSAGRRVAFSVGLSCTEAGARLTVSRA